MQTEPKSVGVTILISNKIDFKARAITRGKEEHFHNNKGLI